MSIDYWSVCAALPSDEASEAVEALAGRQECGALVGPDEETVMPGWSGTKAVDVKRVAAAYAGRLPAAELWESAAVALTEDWLERLPMNELIMTNRSSALSGLDRVLALPRGVSLLRGHALARVPNAQLAALTDALDGLWKKLGGRAAAAATLQDQLYGNANDGAAEQMIELLTNTIDTATKQRLDVLLLSAIPP